MLDLFSSTHGTTVSPGDGGRCMTSRIAMSMSCQPPRMNGPLTVASWDPCSTFCWSVETPWPLMTWYFPASPAALSAPGSVSVNAPLTETMYLRFGIRLAAETTAGTRSPPSICGSVKSSSVTEQDGQSLAISALYAVTIGSNTV